MARRYLLWDNLCPILQLRCVTRFQGAGVPQSTVMRFLCLSLLILSSSIVWAADEVVRQAQALVDKGQPQAAYDLLKPMEEARAGDPVFDYTYGLSALDSGRPLEAVFALERAIDAATENGPARAELARAYLTLGDTDEAKGEFDKLKEMDLPSDVERTIDSYISSIDQYHDKSRLRYRPYVKMGLGYDTNVNSETDENVIAVPALGGLAFNLTDSSRESDSPIWDLGAGPRITSPLDYGKGLSLFINGEIDHRLALDAADFSALLANGQVGLNWRRDERNQFRLSLDGNTVRVEGSSTVRSDREVIGTSGQWQYTMDEANQFTLFGQASLVRYPEQRVRDVNRYTGGVGWGTPFSVLPSTLSYSSAPLVVLRMRKASRAGGIFHATFLVYAAAVRSGSSAEVRCSAPSPSRQATTTARTRPSLILVTTTTSTSMPAIAISSTATGASRRWLPITTTTRTSPPATMTG